MLLPALLLPVVLLSCGCPDFSSIEVVDQSGNASDDALSSIEDTVDGFQQATGLDGVCIDKVVLQDQVKKSGHELSGFYNPVSHRILLDASNPQDALVHELCHGADHVMGSPSLDHPDLFEEASVTQNDQYRTKGARRREAFARACEVFSWEQGWVVTRAVDDYCGQAWDEPMHTWMRRKVYTFLPDPDIEIDFDDIAPTGGVRSLGGLLGDAYVLALGGSQDAVVAVVALGGGRPGLPGSGQRLSVVRIDPVRWTVLSRARLPVVDLPNLAVLGGDRAVIVATNTLAGSQAWEVEEDGSLQPMVADGVSIFSFDSTGYADADHLWVMGARLLDGGDATQDVVVVDRATGQATGLPAEVQELGVVPYDALVQGPGGPWLRLGDMLYSLSDGNVVPGIADGSPLHRYSDGTLLDGRYLGTSFVRYTPAGLDLTIDSGVCDGELGFVRALRVGHTTWLAYGYGAPDDIALQALDLPGGRL